GGGTEQGAARTGEGAGQAHGDGEVGEGEGLDEGVEVVASASPDLEHDLLDTDDPAVALEQPYRGAGIEPRAGLVAVVLGDEHERAPRMAGTQETVDVGGRLCCRLVPSQLDEYAVACAYCRPLLVATKVGQGGIDLADGDTVSLPGAEGREIYGFRHRRPSASRRRSASAGPQVPAS